MAILLNIDTAEETASVCLSRNSQMLTIAVNEEQKDHAAWLHSAIHDLLTGAGLTIRDIRAVAINIGPGSYTGLRIGLSAAKGLCYALNIPLITVNSLEIIAHAIKNEQSADYICPMIDARRMEVFTALYDTSLKEISQPAAMVIDQTSFSALLTANRVVFCGSGCKKLQSILQHPNAIFDTSKATAVALVPLSCHRFTIRQFADLAYTEPLYIKDFYSSSRRPFK